MVPHAIKIVLLNQLLPYSYPRVRVAFRYDQGFHCPALAKASSALQRLGEKRLSRQKSCLANVAEIGSSACLFDKRHSFPR